MRSGYQHVYFNSIEYQLDLPPPSLFVHVMVGAAKVSRPCFYPLLFLQTKGGEGVEERVQLRDPDVERPNLLFIALSVEENIEMQSIYLSLEHVRGISCQSVYWGSR